MTTALSEILMNLGKLYHKQENYPLAVSYLLESLSYCKMFNDKGNAYQVYQSLAQSCEAMGNFKQAFYAYKQFHEIKETIFNEETNTRFQELEVTYRTETAKKETEIYQLKNVALEQEIQERHKVEADLRLAKEEAEAANQAKSEFLSGMSHKLRTPLNAILGYAQILQRDNTLIKFQRQSLTTMYNSGQHLLMLINDILDLSKIEAYKMELIPTELHLRSFLEGIAGIIQIRAETNNIMFSLQIAPGMPEGIVADEKRLRQVLLNLLGNAVKFTSNGGVTLKASQLEAHNDQNKDRCTLQFEVIDTGIGIATEDIEAIFEPFEQAGEGEMQQLGTGLGLAISQKLMKLMDGVIQVESTPGVGKPFLV